MGFSASVSRDGVRMLRVLLAAFPAVLLPAILFGCAVAPDEGTNAVSREDSVVGTWSLSEMTTNGTTHSVEELAQSLGTGQSGDVSVVLEVLDDGSFELRGSQDAVIASGTYERVERGEGIEPGESEFADEGWAFSVDGSQRHVDAAVVDGRLLLHDPSAVESTMAFERE